MPYHKRVFLQTLKTDNRYADRQEVIYTIYMKLSLHRSKSTPDWLLIPVARRNRWQRVAKKTNGIVTPANAVTIIGLGIAGTGIAAMLTHHFWWAIILLSVGRLLDVADGVIADKTGTKSGLGELLDATVDKVVTVLTVMALFIAHTAPVWLLVVFILPHLIISIIVVYGRARKLRLHPSRLGKTTMLLVWIAIPLLLVINALEVGPSSLSAQAVYAVLLISAAFGFITAYSYLPKSGRP